MRTNAQIEQLIQKCLSDAGLGEILETSMDQSIPTKHTMSLYINEKVSVTGEELDAFDTEEAKKVWIRTKIAGMLGNVIWELNEHRKSTAPIIGSHCDHE